MMEDWISRRAMGSRDVELLSKPAMQKKDVMRWNLSRRWRGENAELPGTET